MIATILQILLTIILPIFILIFIGFIFDRKFKPDMETLSKLNFIIFVPAIIFVKMVDTALSFDAMIIAIVFNLIHFGIMTGIALVVFSHPKLREKRTIQVMGTLFQNVGNYGIPFVIFAFGDELIDVLAITLIIQNILTFSFGLWLLEREAKTLKEILKGLTKVPVIYAVIAGLLLRIFNLPLPPIILDPLNIIAYGVIPLALITLGAKLSRVRLSRNVANVLAITILRLIVSPLVAVMIVIWLSLSGPVAQMLVVTSGLPVAVNVYILASEYKNDEDLASQAVFWTTLLSAISVSIILAAITW